MHLLNGNAANLLPFDYLFLWLMYCLKKLLKNKERTTASQPSCDPKLRWYHYYLFSLVFILPLCKLCGSTCVCMKVLFALSKLFCMSLNQYLQHIFRSVYKDLYRAAEYCILVPVNFEIARTFFQTVSHWNIATERGFMINW